MSFEDEIELRGSSDTLAYGGHLVHEDGSHTFVYFGDQDDFEAANPRDNDGNVVHLVGTRNEFKPLDDEDTDIAMMREAADFLGERWVRTSTNMFSRTQGFEVNRYANEEREEFHLVIDLPRPQYTSGRIWLDLDDRHQAYAALGYCMGWDAEETVKHFIAVERPDIAHYEHHWQVSGSTQSDWNEGWAYVTWEDLHAMGIDLDTYFPEEIYAEEFGTYSLWFSGEVYWAAHVTPGPQEHVIGDQGGYYLDTHEYTEDTCGGFLGYANFADLATQLTNSPVVSGA